MFEATVILLRLIFWVEVLELPQLELVWVPTDEEPDECELTEIMDVGRRLDFNSGRVLMNELLSFDAD